MKNNYIFLILSFLIISIGLYFIEKSSENKYIKETENEIYEMSKEKNEVFNLVDKTLETVSIEKVKKEEIIDSLNNTIINKEKNNHKHLTIINGDKILIEELININKNLNTKIDDLNKTITNLMKDKNNLLLKIKYLENVNKLLKLSSPKTKETIIKDTIKKELEIQKIILDTIIKPAPTLKDKINFFKK